MRVAVALRSSSVRNRVVRRSTFERLAKRICTEENVPGDVEISVLLCDDDIITELNRKYRRKNAPTDVLSFEPDADTPLGEQRALGDIAISLETAERNCGGDRALMGREVELLFCHGLLHLLGYDHGTRAERARMQSLQAQYLGTTNAAAWAFGPKTADGQPAPRGGRRRHGR